jgi:hypothetical protein
VLQSSIDDRSLILDVEGHKCLMVLFGEESKVPRNHLPELNCEVETASFRVFCEYEMKIIAETSSKFGGPGDGGDNDTPEDDGRTGDDATDGVVDVKKDDGPKDGTETTGDAHPC